MLMLCQFLEVEQDYMHSQLFVCIGQIARCGLTSLSEAPSD